PCRRATRLQGRDGPGTCSGNHPRFAACPLRAEAAGRRLKAGRSARGFHEAAQIVATPAGFEPATTRLEGECSIQLSYGVVASVSLRQRATTGQVRIRS